MPNGVARNFTGINYWTPAGEGAAFELSPILSPLAPFRDRMVVVSGLAQHQADAFDDGANGDHTRGTSSWLTGVHCKRTEGADVRNGISADQIAASALGGTTPLPSLELAIDLNFLAGQCENSYSCAYLNTLAWRSPTAPLPTENNPRLVFERLFGDGGTPAQRQAQARENRSLLDSVMADLARLQKDLGPADRARVGEYLDAVREVEGRIQRAERRGPDESLAQPGSPGRHSGALRRAREADVRAAVAGVPRRPHAGRHVHARARAQLPHLSRDRHQRRASRAVAPPGQPGAAGEVRAAGHVSGRALRLVPRASCARRRTATASLLDHSLFLYGAGLSNPNLHAHYDLPLAVVGGAGGVRGGRHVVFRQETPMTNLLLSMLDKVGAPAETLGDSSGRLMEVL